MLYFVKSGLVTPSVAKTSTKSSLVYFDKSILAAFTLYENAKIEIKGPISEVSGNVIENNM